MGFASLKCCIEEATKYISPDVVANLLSAEDQKRTFERVVETARPVWR
jgi:hypothetical protein